MFGLSFEKFLLIGVVAAFILGPTRLPGYAAKLGRFVGTLRAMAASATSQIKAELGPDFDDVEWSKLDPRQYDPRRIIRDALLDEVSVRPVVRPVSSDVAARASADAETGAAAANEDGESATAA
jgi:sec-independent protein translocase protein TatB